MDLTTLKQFYYLVSLYYSIKISYLHREGPILIGFYKRTSIYDPKLEIEY
jgi:hypothetical protein